jgi:hypothetical protein
MTCLVSRLCDNDSGIPEVQRRDSYAMNEQLIQNQLAWWQRSAKSTGVVRSPNPHYTIRTKPEWSFALLR